MSTLKQSWMVIVALCVFTVPASAVQVADVANVELDNILDQTGQFVQTGSVEFEIIGFLVSEGTIGYANLVVDMNQDGIIQVDFAEGAYNEWLVDNFPITSTPNAVIATHSMFYDIQDPIMPGVSGAFFIEHMEISINNGDPVGILSVPMEPYPVIDFMYPFPESEVYYPDPELEDGSSAVSTKGTPYAPPIRSMPDIPQKKNECGPTSTANSLLWLAKKHGWTKKLAKASGLGNNKSSFSDSNSTSSHSSDEDALIKKLMEHMLPADRRTRPISGLRYGELEKGKKSFAKKNGLPIEVHGGSGDAEARGASTWEWMKKEMAKGQDVEFLVYWPKADGTCCNGGHWVTVVGVSKKADGTRGIATHNPDDKKGTSRRPHVEHWKVSADGTKVSRGPKKAFVARAVAESPITTKANMKDYHTTYTGPNVWTDPDGRYGRYYKKPTWVNDTTTQVNNIQTTSLYKTIHVYIEYKTSQNPSSPPAISVATSTGNAPTKTKMEWSDRNRHLRITFTLPDQPAWERVVFPSNGYRNMTLINRMDISMRCRVKPDCNENGTNDIEEIESGTVMDVNTNGIPDTCDYADCNGNSLADIGDIAAGTSVDCDEDGVPDECMMGSAVDCNNNGLIDFCEIDIENFPDCNLNRNPDDCDITGGMPDVNVDYIPDGCQDCDMSGTLDPDEINAAGGSGGIGGALDCNENGILDSCDINPNLPVATGDPMNIVMHGGTSTDQNGNLLPDDCEFSGPGLEDCNSNGVIDGVDIQSGLSFDNGGYGFGGLQPIPNGVPDECDPDENRNGEADFQDILWGTEMDILNNLTQELEPDGLIDVACPCGATTDLDFDNDVDAHDFSIFQRCFENYYYGFPSGILPYMGCSCADYDQDGAISVDDLLYFVGSLAGPEDMLFHETPPTCGSGEYVNTPDEDYPLPMFPGPEMRLADDIQLEGFGARHLQEISIGVMAEPGLPFGATLEILDGSPCEGGVPIPGAFFIWDNQVSEVYEDIVTLSATPMEPIRLPNEFWVVVQFNSNDVGWVVAGQAETGFTQPYFGLSFLTDWICNETIPEAGYGGFQVNLSCTNEWIPIEPQ